MSYAIDHWSPDNISESVQAPSEVNQQQDILHLYLLRLDSGKSIARRLGRVPAVQGGLLITATCTLCPGADPQPPCSMKLTHAAGKAPGGHPPTRWAPLVKILNYRWKKPTPPCSPLGLSPHPAVTDVPHHKLDPTNHESDSHEMNAQILQKEHRFRDFGRIRRNRKQDKLGF